MVNMFKQTLLDAGCFVKQYPAILKVGMDTVHTNAPEKMKALMIMTELMVYASNLRKPIMWEKSKIPVNTISFVIAGSGIGKDSSMQMIRKALAPGYAKINKHREDYAKVLAVEDAENDGKRAKDWRKYYSKPRDLFSGIGTLPGQMKHLARLEAGKLGAGYIQVSELGSELQSNKDIAENIVALAIGYDSGFIPSKVVKDDAAQVDPIMNLPFSGLMFGSPDNIIFDESVKAKFKEEFSTKLSRRSFFSFSQETPIRKTYNTVEEFYEARRKVKEASFKAMESLEPWLTALVDATTHTPLVVEEGVEDLFEAYKEYNDLFADTMTKQHPMSILHRQHMQWKALKLAGALAILENQEELTKQHYVDAINFSEIFSEDLEKFEIELSKEPYELFADFMLSISENGYASISIHKLRKMGYIKGTGAAQGKMLELIDLAKSYDSVNRFEYAEGYIHFYEAAEEQIQEDLGGLA
jgi:hypothetical protein